MSTEITATAQGHGKTSHTLRAVFQSAISHQTTLVIAEDHQHARELFNAFVSLPEVQERLRHNAAKASNTNMEVDFWPAKPVRFLWEALPGLDPKLQFSYPQGTPSFVIPRKPA